ncbi:MAG: hypothetical protein ACLQOO_10145 [Terriglobia bacterium]
MKRRYAIIAHINIARHEARDRVARLRIWPYKGWSRASKTRVVWCSALTLALLTFPLRRAAATAIVVVRIPTEVFIGADSKEVLRGTGADQTSSTCKIRQVGDVFVASSGTYRTYFASEPVQFDAFTIARDSLEGPGTIEERVAAFEKKVQPPLSAAMQDMHDRLPADYAKYIEGKAALEVAFVGIEKGSSVVLVRQFMASASTSGRVSIATHRDNCPGDCPGGNLAAFLGLNEEMAAYADAYAHEIWKADIPQAIEQLIRLEITKYPKFVGEPIDILRVDSNGATWLQRNPQCPDVKSAGR